MDFQSYYKEKQESVNNYLNGVFGEADEHLEEFYEMMRYPLMAKSKRLRPILVLMATEILGGDESNAYAPASALELVHTYSLVHDDLPSMDNSDLRRGLPTVHVKHGEANAVLVGDGLLTHAFYLLASCNLDGERRANLVGELSYAAGIAGMVGGQFLDLKHEKNGSIDLEEMRKLDALKTGALIRCACRMGVIVAGGNEEDMRRLTEYGEQIGIAFQIQDDILNVVGKSEEMGKPVGNDNDAQKATYVKFLGLEAAKMRALDAVEKSLEALSIYREKASMLASLSRFVIERVN